MLMEKMRMVILRDPGNYVGHELRIYDPPLLGIARADDPLFAEMKKEEVVGELFRLPEEWLPGAASVISYFLPFTPGVRRSNHSPGPASVEWLHGRFRGEEFNNGMRQLLVQELQKMGGKAVAPALENEMVIDYNTYRSNWSERHVAFAAGLGTFSLNRGLITGKGMAGRFGSVITDLQFEHTPREYRELYQYCPWMVDGSCGQCVDRCPSGAISGEGKDKAICSRYLFVEDPLKETREKFDYPYSACGKCQTGVSCEDRRP